MFVPSFNLIVSPTVAEVPNIISSTALFESKSRAEFAVATPGTWSNKSEKY